MKVRRTQVRKIRRTFVTTALALALTSSFGAANAAPAGPGTHGRGECDGLSPRIARVEQQLCTGSGATVTPVTATSASDSSSIPVDLEWIVFGAALAATSGLVSHVRRSHRHAIA